MKQLIKHLYMYRDYREFQLSRSSYGKYQQGYFDGSSAIIEEVIDYYNRIVNNKDEETRNS